MSEPDAGVGRGATPGYHHVQLVCGDRGRSLRFYRDLLGFSVVATASNGTMGSTPLYLGDRDARPGRLIALDVQPGARRGRWGVGGVHHFALGVETEAAQLKWKRRLTDAGVAVTGPYDRSWFHSIYFMDPDRQVVEIATSGPGYAKDEPIERLGAQVIEPGAERLRGGRDEAAIAARTHPEPVPEITPDMVLHGLHHVTGFTDDIVRADEFYHAALGLRLVKRSVNQDDPTTPHWFWANYDGARVLPHSSYTLFEWKGSDYRARPGVGQMAHVAFRIGDTAPLAAWADHLRGLGVDVEGVSGGFGFTAPDGQRLLLVDDDVR